MTSWRLCHELAERRDLQRTRVVVVGEETVPAYDRVRLTTLLEGASVTDLLLAGPEWYAKVGIELHLGEKVVGIERDRRAVVTSSGLEIGYDRLVLATGATPLLPPMAGIERPEVFVYRTVSDVVALRAAAGRARRATIIGGGLLGLEAAKAALDLGLEVTVVEMAPRLMPRQLDEGGAELLRREIERLGVRVHLGRKPVEVGEHGVRCEDGLELPADLVVVAAGVRPASALARSAGLRIAPNGGVLVDERLRTSDEHIFAVGDCAAQAASGCGLVAPGYQMVRVLLANLRGEDTTYGASATATRLKILGIDVTSAGETAGETTVTHERLGIYRKLVLAGGRLRGAIGVGPWRDFDRMGGDVAAGRKVTAAELRRFQRSGRLDGEISNVLEWPAAAVVCTCMGVTRGRIEECASGGSDAAAVCRASSAGMGCGSCRPLVEALVTHKPAAAAPARNGGLLAIALGALALLLAVPLAPGWAVTERLVKLITGYSALGLLALATIIGVRRRWRPLGALGRNVHAAIALGGLGAIVLHTGLALGHNLNAALLTCFLAALGTGALVGVAYAAGRGRRQALWIHLATLLPLPALLAAHVLAAYFYG